MLTWSLTTLLVMLAGLGAGALVVVSLLPSGAATRSWALASAAVAFVALAALTPAAARDRLSNIGAQRATYGGTAEITAHEKCLNDLGRPDLVAAVKFAERHIPRDARFQLVTDSQVLACLTLNLLPRLPINADDADPARNWTIYDRAIPEDVREAAEEERDEPEGERRHLMFNESFILVRPERG